MRFGALSATLLLLSSQALALAPAKVPRPPRGRWSLDLTGEIRHSTLADLDRIAGALDRRGSGQLGVAVVDSTSGYRTRDFATKVFNLWGIGHAGRNDGVLLFVALGDRKAEIILGTGLASVPTSQTDRIMANDIVANFRRGDPDAALVAGANSLSALLLKRPGVPATAAKVAPVKSAKAAKAAPAKSAALSSLEDLPADVEELHAIIAGRKPFPNPRPHGWVIDLQGRLDKPTLAAVNRICDEVFASGRGRLFVMLYRTNTPYAASHLAAALAQKELSSASGDNLYLLVASTNPVEVQLVAPDLIASDSDGRRELARISNGLAGGGDVGQVVLSATESMGKMALEGPPTRSVLEVVSAGVADNMGALLAVLVIGALVGLVKLRRYLRQLARRCRQCGNVRELLTEQADDVFLTSGQATEEQLGSVNYEVWHCGTCKDVRVVSHQALFSGYSRCKECDSRTVSSESTTLEEANYDHGGTELVTETCTACGAEREYRLHTSRLTRPRRPSRPSHPTRSWFSSLGNSPSSSGGGSRSSFGGGSSSGRGSSGSW